MPDCIFCQIVKGEIPGYKIYEDSEFLAFLDIFPKTEGHTLVIPKRHVEWVWDYKNLGGYFETVGNIARHLREASGEKVIRSVVFGIDVPHAHVHLFPGIKDKFNGQKLSGEQMKKFQQQFQIAE